MWSTEITSHPFDSRSGGRPHKWCGNRSDDLFLVVVSRRGRRSRTPERPGRGRRRRLVATTVQRVARWDTTHRQPRFYLPAPEAPPPPDPPPVPPPELPAEPPPPEPPPPGGALLRPPPDGWPGLVLGQPPGPLPPLLPPPPPPPPDPRDPPLPMLLSLSRAMSARSVRVSVQGQRVKSRSSSQPGVTHRILAPSSLIAHRTRRPGRQPRSP